MDCDHGNYSQAFVGRHNGFWHLLCDLSLRMVCSEYFQLSRLASLGTNFICSVHVSLIFSETADGWRTSTDVFKCLEYRECFSLKINLPLTCSLQMTFVCAVYGLSNFAGLFLTLMIEVPVSSLCKIVLLKSDKAEASTDLPMSSQSDNVESQANKKSSQIGNGRRIKQL